MPKLFIVNMAVEKEGQSTPESLVDPNCPGFACLNLAFHQASWDNAQRFESTFWFFL